MAEYNQLPELQSGNKVSDASQAQQQSQQQITAPHASQVTEPAGHAGRIRAAHCDRRQGPRAFSRADHLAQHMRHKHRNHEPVNAQPQAQEQEPALMSVANPHEQACGPAAEPAADFQLPGLQLPPFHYTITRCDRWGLNGFLREVDLNEHLKVHALLQGYVPYQAGPAHSAFPSDNGFVQSHGQELQQDMYNQPVGSVNQNGSFPMYGVDEQDFQQNMYYQPGNPLQDDGFQMNRVYEQDGDFQMDGALGFFE
ncbi:hypothetical protein HD806DRAFT_538054 [Xylariaceae sp. AK1471]|nr:hypothetical protein HD806DRAFT_538054 [Xylariaceae sp. AK1471]